jgi:hypothetical protein
MPEVVPEADPPLAEIRLGKNYHYKRLIPNI